MRRYLIGDLSLEEQERFEDRYLVDQTVFEELRTVENDLIDSYVRGELSVDEARKFESVFLASEEKRQRVEFARALVQVVAEARQTLPTPKASLFEKARSTLSVRLGIPRFALAAVALVLAVSGAWLLQQNWRLQTSLQQANAGQARLRTEIASTHIESAVALSLMPDSLRDVRGLGAPLPAFHSPLVELKMVLEKDNHSVYQAELQTVDGDRVLRAGDLHSHKDGNLAVVSWSVPVNAVRPASYVVELKGQNDGGKLEYVESYSFNVTAK